MTWGCDKMKIEKISDSQIKVLLNQSDLKERNIKLNELAYGSEKTQALFREMMEQAVNICDFHVENTPLMIEAIPVSTDSIMIIVSKVNESVEIENKSNLIPSTKDERKFKRTSIIDNTVEQNQDDDKISIYSFKTLDDVMNLSVRIKNIFHGSNTLYKYDKKYFLVVQNDNINDNIESDDIDTILSEYGEKHISTVISKYFLAEHGEIIVKKDAVKILSSI